MHENKEVRNSKSEKRREEIVVMVRASALMFVWALLATASSPGLVVSPSNEVANIPRVC